ncbi:MAG: MSCRAMM family adhesin SdrC [Caldilineaceae bacterium]|nr:MSCRAMM family adhesin SdrC [Caldilineaceae bacterium]
MSRKLMFLLICIALAAGWLAVQPANVSAEGQPSEGNVCAVDCYEVQLVSFVENGNGTTTLKWKITVNCDRGLSHVSFALPNGIVALAPQHKAIYTAPSGRQYEVENPTNNPFYSIKFNAIGNGIKNGQSEIFTYTIPGTFDPSAVMQVEMKAGTNQKTLTFSPEDCQPTPPTATPTNTPTATDTPVPPTNTPTATNTPVPPTNTPTATNTPVPPTNTPTATDTPVPPTNTPTATNTPAPSLNLTFICSYVGDNFLMWRVANPNAFPVDFTWDVYGEAEAGSGSVLADDAVYFYTSTGSKTVRLFVGGNLVDTKASGEACKVDLSLSYSCDDEGNQVWTVFNGNDFDQPFGWYVSGSNQSGNGSAPAMSTASFTTSNGAHTVVVESVHAPHAARQVNASAEVCAAPEEPTATPTDTPEDPTATPTNTPESPTTTPTNTPEPPTNTPTATPTPEREDHDQEVSTPTPTPPTPTPPTPTPSTPEPAAIGDRVWLDRNANGVQEEGEPGVAGIGVTLLDGNGAVVAVTTTDEDGLYGFEGLTPGDYAVQFMPPAGYRFSPRNQGGDSAGDSDADPQTGATVVTTLYAGEIDLTWDAGIYQPAAIGDLVWEDANANGTQDAGEAPVAGVMVQLYATNHALVGELETNQEGRYGFTELTPGSYYLVFAPSSLPNDYRFTEPNQGSDPAADSDADPVTGRTAVVTLLSGQVDLTWDAGLLKSVGGNTPTNLDETDEPIDGAAPQPVLWLPIVRR